MYGLVPSSIAGPVTVFGASPLNDVLAVALATTVTLTNSI
jgi:hypothetical protein